MENGEISNQESKLMLIGDGWRLELLSQGFLKEYMNTAYTSVYIGTRVRALYGKFNCSKCHCQTWSFEITSVIKFNFGTRYEADAIRCKLSMVFCEPYTYTENVNWVQFTFYFFPLYEKAFGLIIVSLNWCKHNSVLIKKI